jgi:hypothetical protein
MTTAELDALCVLPPGLDDTESSAGPSTSGVEGTTRAVVGAGTDEAPMDESNEQPPPASGLS